MREFAGSLFRQCGSFAWLGGMAALFVVGAFLVHWTQSYAVARALNVAPLVYLSVAGVTFAAGATSRKTVETLLAQDVNSEVLLSTLLIAFHVRFCAAFLIGNGIVFLVLPDLHATSVDYSHPVGVHVALVMFFFLPMYVLVAHFCFAFAAENRAWMAVLKTIGTALLAALCIWFLYTYPIEMYNKRAMPSGVLTPGAVTAILVAVSLCMVAWAVFIVGSWRLASRRFHNALEVYTGDSLPRSDGRAREGRLARPRGGLSEMLGTVCRAVLRLVRFLVFDALETVYTVVVIVALGFIAYGIELTFPIRVIVSLAWIAISVVGLILYTRWKERHHG